MEIFNSMKEPVFLKESSNAEEQLARLRALEASLDQEGQRILKQDIKFLEYGMIGEKNIIFELKHSHMPIYILHDIYLEDEDMSAQIDFLVFTKKICFVIECKNLYGNIEINSAGDFIRTTDFGYKKKEGIYSPIAQNQRHLELMKKIKTDNRGNILTKFLIDKHFEDYNKPIVVLANPKTVLNAKFAKKEVKDKVIRADQLVKYIKDTYQKSKESAYSEDRMLAWAQSYLDIHKDTEKDYTEKYNQYKIDKNISKEKNINGTELLLEETELFKELKIYRLNKSREEKIKPYFIYNDNQLKDLILKNPKNKEELKEVSGFGEAKANKYGEEILKIMRSNCVK